MSQMPQATEPAPLAASFPLDLAALSTRYVNFCRVMGTPEEMVIDFGLQAGDQPSDGVWQTDQRVILTLETAKRLLGALQATLAHHESTFGVIETNIDKRVVESAKR
jgi:hypothetical protein